ncbi:hypothetical protein [Natrinema saccharevitans]|uniref:hypothetical protein n=1 Tax=Natrinema saccharevitans TaxID=301967 RepID=UPI0011158B39|nr:hypothetical protein [Natrinema saccharevitans]
MNRRRALKTIAVSTVTGAGLTTTVSANNGARKEGVAYDPFTHEILGEASGQFNERKENFVGNLRVNGKKYNMNQPELFEENEEGDMKSRTYRDINKISNKEYNRIIEVRSSNNSNITGFVRSPESLDRVAFALEGKQTGSHDRIINFLKEGGE